LVRRSAKTFIVGKFLPFFFFFPCRRVLRGPIVVHLSFSNRTGTSEPPPFFFFSFPDTQFGSFSFFPRFARPPLFPPLAFFPLFVPTAGTHQGSLIKTFFFFFSSVTFFLHEVSGKQRHLFQLVVPAVPPFFFFFTGKA